MEMVEGKLPVEKRSKVVFADEKTLNELKALPTGTPVGS